MKQKERTKLKLKKGDTVIVVTGKDKGKEGTISKVFPELRKIIVAGVNMITKHQKQTRSQSAGRITKEAPLDISNVAFKDPTTGKPSRIGYKIEDGAKVRIAKASGTII